MRKSKPMNPIDDLRTVLGDLAATLKWLEAPGIAAQPEDQLKSPVKRLLSAVGQTLKLRVDSPTEVRIAEGRPDIGVLVRGLLCGFVELKAPGKGARTERLKGADTAQWEKFKSLPNLIYTDGLEWSLYRSGERVGKIVSLPDGPADPETAADLMALLRKFILWEPLSPSSPRDLAEMLAPLCHLLREDVLEALREPESAISQVAAEWREALFPEADDPQFADAYAQTITYTLLLARFEGERHVATDSAERILRRKHGLLAQSLRILADPQAKREIELGVGLLERAISAVDLTALQVGLTAQQRKSNDPWLYFYEDFLAKYDPKLRNDRGVYYTPVEVILCQCRLVAELLRRHFAKPLAFAEEGVTLLDPGAGTGAYLLAAFKMGCEAAATRQGKGAVAGRASLMALNIHGFEILVGPYAVAHLRLTQAILDAGGEVPDDGVHLYLTDTLESPHAEPLSKLPLQQKPLADEHRRAQKIKRDTPIRVCIGNPPYNRQQIDPDDVSTDRKGGWVRFGEQGDDGILNDFLRPARTSGQSIHLKNLYNDYVYFWRWALWKVFEEKRGSDGLIIQPASPGIVAFITASSYLRGPGFVGMRRVMRETFDEMWIIDLEGDVGGPRKTENIFAIRTPVAIAIGVRYEKPRPGKPAKAHYIRLEGTREAKLVQLSGINNFDGLRWRECPYDWEAPFLPVGEGDYFRWPLLTDLFPWQYSGVQFKRTWPIGETRSVLEARWKKFATSTLAEKRKLFRETSGRRVDGRYEAIGGGTLPPLTNLTETDLPGLKRFAFRSLDRQWALLDPRIADRIRTPLLEVDGERQVFLTTLLTGVLGLGPAAIVAGAVPDLHHFRGSYGGKDTIPLYRDSKAEEPNVTRGLLSRLSAELGHRVNAEDLFAYCYALLATPAYVQCFSEELATPGPRIPITQDARVFSRSVKLGRQLVFLHTYGARFAEEGSGVPVGRARCIKGLPSRPNAYPENFGYDASSRTLNIGEGAFAPVSEAVWNFSVSGWEVVKAWLSYRMKGGAGRNSSPLDEVRPERWTSEMTDELLELLWVLEATIALFPELKKNLSKIIAGPVFSEADLPQPKKQERKAPNVVEQEETQHELPGV